MAEVRHTKFGSGAVWIVAAMALVLIFFAVRRLTRQNLPVRAAESQVQDLIKTISTNGKVEPQPQVNFAAHAPQAGAVKEIYVHPGESVAKNQLLLALDDADARARLASAAAAIRGAQANLRAVTEGGTEQERVTLTGKIDRARIEREQAERNLASLRKLAAQGAAAPSEVAEAGQRLQIAAASLSSLEQQKSHPFAAIDLAHARSAVEEAEAAYAAAAQLIAQSNVRAPFRGTVYSLPVSPYDYVETGAPLVAVADLSRMQVRAYFDEPEIGDLQLGNPVTIIWDAKPGRQWHGRILRLPSTIITYGTRNVGEVLVSVDDPDGVLLPNTNVTVTVVTQGVRNALTVPREALHIEDGRDYVYTVSDGYLDRRRVRVGAINLTQVQILSGLQNHVLVALGTVNGAPLATGLPVEIVK